MAFEREQAIGRLTVLRKKIYELGIKAQSLFNDLAEETNFISDPEKDFLSVDCKKAKVLLDEIQKCQIEFNKLSEEANKLKTTFNIEE